jgi:hypothetical protein
MIHKATLETKDKSFRNQIYNTGRCGFHYLDLKEIEDNDKVKHVIGTEIGRYFNEGVTELALEKMLGVKDTTKGYKFQTFFAKYISKLVGEDVLFEAFFFNPRILENKLTEITKNQYAFVNMLGTLDEYGSITPKNKLHSKFLKLKYGWKFITARYKKTDVTPIEITYKKSVSNIEDDESGQNRHNTREQLQVAHGIPWVSATENRADKTNYLGHTIFDDKSKR